LTSHDLDACSHRAGEWREDVFVHTFALAQSGISALKEGDKVSFEIEDDTRGRRKQAAKVELS